MHLSTTKNKNIDDRKKNSKTISFISLKSCWRLLAYDIEYSDSFKSGFAFFLPEMRNEKLGSCHFFSSRWRAKSRFTIEFWLMRCYCFSTRGLHNFKFVLQSQLVCCYGIQSCLKRLFCSNKSPFGHQVGPHTSSTNSSPHSGTVRFCMA